MLKEHSIQAETPKRLPQPKETGKPLNPAEPHNWRNVEPETQEEMDEWLEAEKKLLLAYLVFYKALAEDDSTRERIADAQTKVDKEWKKWESEYDTVTGEIVDEASRQRMDDAMAEASKELTKAVRKKQDGLSRIQIQERYIHALGLWEDFHYLQNAGNRPRTKDVRDARGPSYIFQGTIATMPKEANNKGKVITWQENLIRLFNKWDIGDRSRLTRPTGPEQLHVFPDNLRHTARHPKRRETLSKQFPVSDVRLDDDAVAERRAEVEKERRKREKADRRSVDRTKYEVLEKLPEDHQPYDATTERSSPWKYKDRRVRTSWKSADWGHAVESKKRVLGGRKESERTSYATHSVPHTVQERITLLGPTCECRRDGLNGGWSQGELMNMREENIFLLDKKSQRISVTPYVYDRPTYTPAGTVTTAHASDGACPARREKYSTTSLLKCSGTEYPDELSGVADEDDYRDDGAPLSDMSEGEEQLGTDPLSDSDEESDDEGDLFTRAYLGLDTVMNDGSTLLGSDSSGDSNKSNEIDDKDGHPNLGGAGVKPTRRGTRGDRKGRNPSKTPGAEGASQKKRRLDTVNETFEDGQDEQGNFFWATMVHTCPDGRTFTQRDRVPSLHPDATETLDREDNPALVVYPRAPTVPVPRLAKYEGMKWVRGEDGVYRRGDLIWRPTFILRLFRRDTGEYLANSDLRGIFDEVIQSDFSKKSVDKFNKRVRQYLNRNDAEFKQTLVSQPRWTKQEVAEAVSYLNEIVRQKGLIYLAENWETVRTNATPVLDQYRMTIMNDTARGEDSIRTKFSPSRAVGLHRKLRSIREREGRIPTAELRPTDFFTVKDFAPRAEEKEKGTKTQAGTKTRKRKAAGNIKKDILRTKVARGSDDEASDEEDDWGFEMTDGDEEEGRSGSSSQPPRKRHKSLPRKYA